MTYVAESFKTNTEALFSLLGRNRSARPHGSILELELLGPIPLRRRQQGSGIGPNNSGLRILLLEFRASVPLRGG